MESRSKRDRLAEQTAPMEIRDKRDARWFWMDTAVIDQYAPQIAPHGVAVYAVLARHANKTGQAWPSLKTIAATLGLSKRSVLRALALLCTAQLIHKEIRYTDAGDHAANVYTLLAVQGGGGVPQTPPSVPQTPRGSVPQTPRSAPQTPELDLKNQIQKKNQKPLLRVSPFRDTPRQRRTCRVPTTYRVPEADWQWVRTACPHVDAARETEKWRDYEYATPKSDWRAAWRNWMRKAEDYLAPARETATGAPLKLQY